MASNAFKTWSIRILKGLGFLVLFVILLVVGLVIALQFSSVQTFVTKKAAGWVEGKIGTEVRIARVDIDFVKTLVLEGVYAEDKSGDTLLYAGKLEADIGLFALGKQKIHLDLITLENAVVKLSKPADKDTFNFQYIITAFSSDSTKPDEPVDTTKKGWGFDMSRLALTNIRFRMDDKFNGNLLESKLGSLVLDVNTLGLDEQHIKLERFAISGLRATFFQNPKNLEEVKDTIVDKVEDLVAKGEAELLNPSSWKFDLNHLNLDKIYARYDVTKTPSQTGKFDPLHVDVRDFELKVSQVRVRAQDVLASIDHLKLEENYSGVKISELKSKIEIHNPEYLIALKELRTPNSVLNDGITVGIKDINDIKNLAKTMVVRSRFSNDSVTFADIRPFTPVLDTIGLGNKVVYLNGELNAENHAIRAVDLNVAVNGANYIALNGTLHNYTDLQNMRPEELSHTFRLQPRYVAQFLPKGSIPAEVLKWSSVKAQGKMSGKLSGLSGNLFVETPDGRVALDRYFYKTDANFKSHQGSVSLSTQNLSLAAFLGPSIPLGPIDMNARIDGGYSEKTGPIVRKSKVVIERARYDKYTYRNAVLEGTYIASVAKARLRYKDRNIMTDMRASADMRPRDPLFTADGPLYANLQALGFNADTLQFGTDLKARIRGTDPNRMVGFASLRKTKLNQAGKRAQLDSLLVQMGFDSSMRLIEVKSEALQARLIGKYDITRLGDALIDYIAHYVPLSGLKRIRNLPEQQFRLSVHVPAAPVALETFVPGLKIPQPLSARIDFDSRKNQFDTKVNIADLRFDKNQVAGLTFTTNSKPNQWDIDLAAAVIAADSFVIPEPRVAFEIKEGDAKFTLRVASDEADSRTRMRGRILSVGDITRILLDSSDLYLKKQRWNLDRKSLLEFGTNHLVVRNLKLENQEDTSKYVRIETPAGIAKNALTAQIHNLLITDITRLLPPLGYNLQGIIHLDADVDNVFTASGLKANLAVDSLAVENIPAGRFIAKANQPSTNLVALSAALEKGANSLKLDGRYNIADTNNALAFRLKMDNFQPEEIAPILRDVLTKFDGDLSSDIAITGRVSNPKIEGFIAFNGLNVVQPAATQVPYRITDQRIVFDERRVELNKFTLADEENHTLVVDGTVGLREVDAPVLNLSIDAKEFNIINNRASDNPTFYGKAFITTHMKVTGPAAKLDVDGTIRTNPGTRVVYNLESGKPGQAGQEAYIIFTDSRNGVRKAEPKLDLKEKVDVTGFGLNMKIQLDKGTRFLVIIDPKTGDQVECEGKADLVFSMRPNGEINLQGDYNLIDGFYSMNLLGLVKRKFKVQEGSVLSWRGSPTDAAINLTAIYTTKASRFELVADQAEALTPAEVQAAKRRLPVDVKLLITNTIMKPVIKFDVVVPEETQGGAIGLVSARLAQMREDENELNKQALGLIAFNRFVTTGTTQGSSGPSTQESVNETVDQTVSDVLSRQLSSLSQEYLGGVEINVNVSQDEFASGSSGGFSDKDVGVSVSKSLFDERLRVSVGGQVSSANNSQSGSSGQPALGDLTAEYRIDKSGNLNAKFFRTYNQNAITANSVERIGLSLAHTKDFSSFPRLFWSKARRDSAIKNERQRLRSNSPAKPPVSMH